MPGGALDNVAMASLNLPACRSHFGRTVTMRLLILPILATASAMLSGAALSQGPLPSSRYDPPPPTMLDAEIAERITGVINLSVNDTRVGGELRGCNLVYVAATRDFTYRRGGNVIVSGSVQLGWSPPHQLYWAMKVVPQDLVIERNGSLGGQTFTPSLAWMRSGRFSTVGRIHQPFMCEGGGFCGAGTEGLLDFMEALLSGQFRLGIQRWTDGQDLTMQLNLAVGPNGEPASEAFSQCALELFDQALHR